MSIVVKDLAVRRGAFNVGPLSFEVTDGICGLAGANGAGKTTLISALVGLLEPRAGEVRLAGFDPWGQRSKSEAMGALGYVPQSASLPGLFTVIEALSYAAWLKGIPLRGCAQKAKEAAKAVGLEEMLEVRCGRLSGGMQRRACIAQALVHEPRVLILDEPTVGLDPVQRQNLHQTLNRIGRTRSVLVSTHLADDLARICETLIVMNAGSVVFTGDIEEICAGRSSRHDAIDELLSDLIGGAS